MIDASIGGKVGINHPRVKNLLGAFHQPRKVVVDPTFLDTLPERELRSGAYEAVKSGIIGDRALFRELHRSAGNLRSWDRVQIDNLVASACRVKAEVVERDEREGGLRRVLNLGHTIGHALEAVTRFRRYTHGEAVGWGLIGAAWIAHKRGLLSESGFDAIAATTDHVGRRPRVADLDPAELLAVMKSDKKVRSGRVVFVLPAAIGRCVTRDDVSRAEIRRALRVMAAREARLS